MMGTLVGQVAVFGVSPFLTRLYSPAEFGSYAAFMAIVGIGSNIAALSWDRAIVIPQEDAEARGLVRLGLLSSIGVSVLLLVCAWWLLPCFGSLGLRATDAPLLALTICGSSLYQVFSAYLVRRERYRTIAFRSGIQGLLLAATSCIFGVVGWHSQGLLISPAVAVFGAILGMSAGLRKSSDAGQPVRLRDVARRYRRFPLMNSGSRLLNAVGLQAPILMVGAILGPSQLGFVSLATRILGSPTALVVTTTSTYFEGTFSKQVRALSGGLAQTISSMSKKLMAVAIVPALVIVVVGPPLFEWVFGAEWAQAGHFARLLMVGYLGQLVVTPISRSLSILERLGTQMIWDAGRCVFVLGAILLVYLVWPTSSSVVVAAWGVTLALCYVALYVVSWRAAKKWEETLS
ncbi:MAG: lipopolysaccharide biosynthesis protein [Propionibacteriaceae bacterium]|nr:lipopolysaccharide biosynthesis protein [Propionibacteriaceae bacterium]